MLTLQETQSTHDSMNLPKIEFIAYTRDDPKVLIVALWLCPETFLRGILCTIQKINGLPLQ